MLGLSEKDARTLAEAPGASRVAEELAELHQKIEGLAIDWLPVREDTPFANRTIGAARVRTRTGVSIVAVLRGDPPQALLEPGFRRRAERTYDQLQQPDVLVGAIREVEEVRG